MLKQWHTLLFDADNTLLDFDRAEQQAFQKTMTAFGLEATPERFALYADINHGLWHTFEQGGITKEALVVERFRRFFDRIGAKVDSVAFEAAYQPALGEGAFLIDGALDLLARLAPHYRLCIITNGVAATQYSRLAASGIDRYVKAVFVSEALGAQKPDPAFFDAVFASLPPTDRTDCLIIGDSLTSDIAGGIRAGIPTCWYNPKGLAAPASGRPDHTVGDYAALLKLLGV